MGGPDVDTGWLVTMQLLDPFTCMHPLIPPPPALAHKIHSHDPTEPSSFERLQKVWVSKKGNCAFFWPFVFLRAFWEQEKIQWPWGNTRVSPGQRQQFFHPAKNLLDT